jgi:Tfp pilus assembly protein PilF
MGGPRIQPGQAVDTHFTAQYTASECEGPGQGRAMLRDHSAYQGFPALRCCLALFVALSASGVALLGQERNGVIYGRVTDAHGNPLRLMVHLLADGDMPAGDMYTDGSGQYAFRALPLGEYWVQVEAEGFQTARQAVRLETLLNPKMQVDLTLEKTIPSPAQPSPVIAGSRSSLMVDAKKPASGDARALQEFAKGSARQKKGDVKGAIAHYGKALRIDPQFYPALNNLGALYERKGAHQQAEQVLLRALNANPNDGESYVNLGHVLYEEGRYAEARAWLEEGVKRSPNSASGWFFLGSTDLRLGNLGSAEFNLKQACSLEPKALPAAHLQLANVYLRKHDLQAANKELDDYLKVNPDDPQAPAIRKLLANVKPEHN